MTDGSDLSHDGYFRLVERAEQPVEEVDNIARLWDDKCVRCLFGGRCGGVLPAMRPSRC